MPRTLHASGFIGIEFNQSKYFDLQRLARLSFVDGGLSFLHLPCPNINAWLHLFRSFRCCFKKSKIYRWMINKIRKTVFFVPLETKRRNRPRLDLETWSPKCHIVTDVILRNLRIQTKCVCICELYDLRFSFGKQHFYHLKLCGVLNLALFLGTIYGGRWHTSTCP